MQYHQRRSVRPVALRKNIMKRKRVGAFAYRHGEMLELVEYTFERTRRPLILEFIPQVLQIRKVYAKVIRARNGNGGTVWERGLARKLEHVVDGRCFECDLYSCGLWPLSCSCRH